MPRGWRAARRRGEPAAPERACRAVREPPCAGGDPLIGAVHVERQSDYEGVRLPGADEPVDRVSSRVASPGPVSSRAGSRCGSRSARSRSRCVSRRNRMRSASPWCSSCRLESISATELAPFGRHEAETPPRSAGHPASPPHGSAWRGDTGAAAPNVENRKYDPPWTDHRAGEMPPVVPAHRRTRE